MKVGYCIILPNNLGEISQLKDGLNGLYGIITAYRKIKEVTMTNNIYMDNLDLFYEDNRRILKGLEKKLKDLK